jgi:glyoxylase-like metal-dependent hydrolase (beta-lactamase superfamily II)
MTPSDFSRRGFLAGATVTAIGTAFLPRWCFAKEPSLVEVMRDGAAKAKLTVEPLAKNLHVIFGSGGNIGVLSGPDGKLLIDGGLAGSRSQLSELLDGISTKPIKHLVNTHWHFDHTDGNEWLHKAGATITAHENTRKHLTEKMHVADWDYDFPPAPKAAVPTEVVEKDHAIKFNGTTVHLNYYGAPGHTDGDLSAHFPDHDVLHCGDTFWNGHYPFIDYGAGGSIDGMIHACEWNLSHSTEKTTLIPGHGAVAKKKELVEFHDMLVSVRDGVAMLKKDGKSVEEAIAAKPTQKFDEKFGGFVITPEHMTRLAYSGV